MRGFSSLAFALLSVAAPHAMAQGPTSCISPSERIAGLRYVRTAQTLADLS